MTQASDLTARVLIVDDERAFANAVATRLRRDGHDCRLAGCLADARAVLGESGAGAAPPDLILLDMRLPDGTGLELLDELRSAGRIGPGAAAVVAVTAFGDIDNAVEAMKRGALDYLRKPLDLDELALVAERVLDSMRLQARLDYSRERDSRTTAGVELLGKSPAMAGVRREIETIAALAGERGNPPPNVLVVGETGTGKDVAARLVHALGPRAERPFVRIDCPTLPREAAEIELFGSAGERAGPGLIEAAEDGTVFLDEVCELPLDMQSKLLAVIERRALRRLGGDRETSVRARFIASTNRELADAVKQGAFRADLFYRLNVLAVRMPPLRECPGDAPLLARTFIDLTARRYGRPAPRLSESAAAALDRYSWPGNVRELQHLMERAVLLNQSGTIAVRDLPLPGLGSDRADSTDPYAALDGMTMEGAERWLMARALERARGNVSAAARELGITRMAMRYRMEKYGF
jgi:DNA-binding NtrC family response regulator